MEEGDTVRIIEPNDIHIRRGFNEGDYALILRKVRRHGFDILTVEHLDTENMAEFYETQVEQA